AGAAGREVVVDGAAGDRQRPRLARPCGARAALGHEGDAPAGRVAAGPAVVPQGGVVVPQLGEHLRGAAQQGEEHRRVVGVDAAAAARGRVVRHLAVGDGHHAVGRVDAGPLGVASGEGLEVVGAVVGAFGDVPLDDGVGHLEVAAGDVDAAAL